jgi:hypothetical protein
MYWSDGAELDDSLPPIASGVTAAAVQYVHAYRCGNGHTSQPCPLCGSFETAGWRDAEGGPHYHLICAACGNDSIA